MMDDARRSELFELSAAVQTYNVCSSILDQSAKFNDLPKTYEKCEKVRANCRQLCILARNVEHVSTGRSVFCCIYLLKCLIG